MFETDSKEELEQQLSAVINRMRSRAEPRLKRWLEIHGAWKGDKTKQFFKSTTFNHYIPYFRRSIERFVKRAAQMVLPSAEYFEVMPSDTMGDEADIRAESVHNYLLYLMRKRIRIYSLAKQWFRTFGLYGEAIAKTSIVVRDGNVYPTVRAVDPFMFLYFPETVNNLDDARLIVEDALLPLEQYNAIAKRVKAIQLESKDLVDPQWPSHLTQRLASSGQTEPKDVQPENKPVKEQSTWVHMSEVWINKGDKWKMVWIVWNKKEDENQAKDVPYGCITHQPTRTYPRPQYRLATDREIPGEQDTSSMGSDQEWMQTLLNDQINMLSEGQAQNLGPPVAIDPNQVGRTDSLIWKPRAKWMVPPGAVTPLTTADTTKTGYQAVHFTMGLMDLFSGSSPLGEGQPIRNMPRAGFAVSSLLSMSLSDIRDAARTIEDDILTPILKDLHDLTIQFIPESQVMRIPGAENALTRLTKKDLEGDYDLTWVGSLQSQENGQRVDAILKLFSSLGKNGEIILADMQRRGVQMNWTALFKRFWREGIGERGSASLIEKVEQPQQPSLSQLPPMGPDELQARFMDKIKSGQG